ncbi:MAG: glycosyltransferase family 2 protein [Acidobacteriia bacterium]|nr:glycosyltransferase family 2 protein [Terriglobia bacterium]
MKLSIVIPTYNAHEWIAQCLDSIRAHRPTADYEVIAVDDTSSDDTVAIVRDTFPDVRVFSNEKNLGFGRTVNAGLKASKGEYILVLNNDTWMHAGALDALIGYLDAHPDTGIVGPKVLSGDGSLQQQCRRRIPTPMAALLYFTGVAKLFPKNPNVAGYLMTAADENATTEVDSVSGACLLVRRSVLETVHGFDEDYFLYGEDMDFCWRTKLAGWKVVYYPQAVITHFGGQGGTGTMRVNATIEWHRAMWIFYRKHRAPAAGAVERALVYTGIAAKTALAVAISAVRRSATPGTAKPQ